MFGPKSMPLCPQLTINLTHRSPHSANPDAGDGRHGSHRWTKTDNNANNNSNKKLWMKIKPQSNLTTTGKMRTWIKEMVWYIPIRAGSFNHVDLHLMGQIDRHFEMFFLFGFCCCYCRRRRNWIVPVGVSTEYRYIHANYRLLSTVISFYVPGFASVCLVEFGIF